jgi:hypothetical protein
MDAYLLYQSIKQLWAEHTNKNSGGISKNDYTYMKACIWTDEGYREIVGASYNPKLKMIELEMDKE